MWPASSSTRRMREDVDNDASVGETRPIREEEDIEAYALEVDASAWLEWTGVSETWIFFLCIDACYAILLYLSLSSLSAIIPVNKQTISTSNHTIKKSNKRK